MLKIRISTIATDAQVEKVGNPRKNVKTERAVE
jgi:hypothetical protein